MTTMDISDYIKTSMSDNESSLLSLHYLQEVLPQSKFYKSFDHSSFDAFINDGIINKFNASREFNESQIEETFIKPIMESLGNKIFPNIPIGSEFMDYCVYEGDHCLKDYTNTIAIIESKRYNRIENKYFIHHENNDDEIYQTLNYLRTVNLSLQNTGSSHLVDFVVLTDGYIWRLYSRSYTHNKREYEQHFLEFNLEKIVNCQDEELRNICLNIFAVVLSKESLSGKLVKYINESQELQVAVTTELKAQTFLALEYIASGIYRNIKDEEPGLMAILIQHYNIDYYKIDQGNNKTDLFKVIYDESLVYLLRLLFVLYAEDRHLFDPTKIPSVIKGEGNILSLITDKKFEPGKFVGDLDFLRDDDVKLSRIFKLIDDTYDGGLFSKKEHPLLFGLNIDDLLFVNAIDCLCRVYIKNKAYTVDFTSISVREIGSIYESLLEYKLAETDKDIYELPSVINNKRIRYNVKKGDLYLINHDGERKSTGSYYTPDLIVEHLVNSTIQPLLDNIKERNDSDINSIIQSVLKIHIVDPAMGSGHMLVAAYNKLVEFLLKSIEESCEKGEIRSADNNYSEWSIRTRVARNCIFGADLNPIAVEIAKLVIWMRLFRPDKPFEFFDYNLICGNSIIGVYDDTKINVSGIGVQGAFGQSEETIIADIQRILVDRVYQMNAMPRESVEMIHEVQRFYKEKILTLQQKIKFLYNAKIASVLMPEESEEIKAGYEELMNNISLDLYSTYLDKVIDEDPTISKQVLNLKRVSSYIENKFRPIHWRVAHPNVTAMGGFDIVLTNPPWDKIKATREEFFSDYIDDYANMETKDAKAASDALMESCFDIKALWDEYENNIFKQNSFYTEYYKYQTATNSQGKVLKGDANLYKVFIEKIYQILKPDGVCGMVVPDNLNIDNGCTGLRHLLLNEATIKELIMFENKNKLFDIHPQYKFDVIVFSKRKSRSNASFDAGFYWYDPIWLDSIPDENYILSNKRSKKDYHRVFKYSISAIKTISPDENIIMEFRNKKLLDLCQKMVTYPQIGDKGKELYISTYREFDMTNDAALFDLDCIGWPLYQGGTIHFYNAYFKSPERYINSQEGEDRLSTKWKCAKADLPGRKYRIAWRDIAQPTDTRSLICTVLPRGVFVGNTLTLIKLSIEDNLFISGINAVLSSLSADFFVRQKMAKHVSAFILKTLPLPRNNEYIRKIGYDAMPLYCGDDFENFRMGIPSINDEDERIKLMAKLDAEVAKLYNLTFEEYQVILSTFPLIEDDYKKRCLYEFKELMLNM